MIDRRALLLAAGSGLALAGCASIPESGPVVRVSQSPQPTSNPGVGISVEPPAPGASIENIVDSFLLAMAAYQPDDQVARQFLTKDAAKTWKPDAGVVIYEDYHRPNFAEEAAALSAPMVGTLDGIGRFTPSQAAVNHDFAMQKQDGQWRIGQAPQGLLMSQYNFVRYFQAVTVHFLNGDGTVLVPQAVHLPRATATPTSAIAALLAGPAPWSRPAVLTALPSDTKSSVASVSLDRDGIAEVSLSAQISALNNAARERVAAQIVWTLEPFEVQGVRITVNGSAWQVSRAHADGTVHASDFTGYLPVQDRAVGPVLALRRGVVGRITDTPDENFVAIAGPFGTEKWGDRPGQIDATANLASVAVVNADRTTLWVWTGATPQARVRGTNLTRPQVMADGSVWVIGNLDEGDGRPRLLRVGANGGVTTMALGGLGSGKVTSFRISPDRTQLALVLAVNKTTQLGMMRISGTEQLIVDGWRPMPAGGSDNRLNNPVDVAWGGAAELVIVSSTRSDTRVSVYLVSSDGARVESIGPPITEAEPQRAAATPRQVGTSAVILTKDGVMWRFEDRSRWVSVMGSVSAIAQPG